MKKPTALVLVMVALAEVLQGTNSHESCVGTPNPDRVAFKGGKQGFRRERLGQDLWPRRRRRDRGGAGEDELFGASGNDTIYTCTEADGGSPHEGDEASCGLGNDNVY